MDPMTGKSAASREEEFLYLLTEGSDLMRAGRVEEAQVHFEKALALSPKDEQAKNLLGLSLFRGGELERAEQLFAELVHDNPVEPSLRLNLALVYLKTEQFDDAERTLEQVLDLAPNHPRAANYMGLILEKQQRYAEAASFYAQAGNTERAEEMHQEAQKATTVIPMPSTPPDSAEAPLAAPRALPEEAVLAHSAPPAKELLAAEPDSAPVKDPPAQNPSVDDLFEEEDDEISFADVAAEVAKTPDGGGPITASATPTAMSTAVSLVDHAPLDDGDLAELAGDSPEPLDIGDDDGADDETPTTEAKPRLDNSGAEAAALTAASRASLDKKTAPPTKEASAEARRRSVNFTFEAEDVTREVAIEPRPVELPQASPAPPPPRPAPLLDDLGPGPLTLDGIVADDGAGHFHIHIDDILYFRTDHIVCLTGELEVEPINRRYRGRRTDSLFGGNEAPLCAAMGRGTAALTPKPEHVRTIELHNEDLYLVENNLLAFSDGLVWENGRLPADDGDDLDIVHLRGTGQVHLMTDRPLIGFAVDAGQPVTIRADRLLGWNGQVVPYRGPFPGLPESARRPAIVRFEGKGVVLGT